MKKFLPWILAGTFFIVGVATARDYGINWDSPDHFMRGNAILHFFLTGKKTFNVSSPSSPIFIKPGELISRYAPAAVETSDKSPDLAARPLPQKDYEDALTKFGKRFSYYQSQFFDMAYNLKDRVPGHLPFADIMAAIGNKVFFQSLGWVGDIASYQLFGLLVGALGIYIVSRFTYELTDSWVASAIAGLALGLYPTFFTHVHINMKDPIVAVFFAGTIWSFWHWVRGNSRKWGVLVCIFFALGLGVKWTIAFVPFIIVPWLILIRKSSEFRRWFQLKKLLVFVGVAAVVILAFLYILSPFLWPDPIHRFMDLFSFYWIIGVGTQRVQPDNYLFWGFNSFPWFLIMAKTPVVLLLFTLISFFAVWREKHADELKSGFLILIWFLFPLVRLTLPYLRFYGDINQYMEILPAIAILSGIGAAYILKKIPLGRASARWILVIGTAVLLAVPIIKLHPNENIYFNSFVGGIRGAKERKLLDWFASYGNVYKQAADWLNVHAEKDANIAHIDGPMFAFSPMFLRDDISISPAFFSGFESRGEYIVQIPDTLGSDNFAYRYPRRELRPVHSVTVGGVPILIIYKNDPKYWKSDLGSEMKIFDPPGRPGSSVNGQYWEIDLGKRVNVTKLVISDVPAKCQKTNTRFIDEMVGFFDAPGHPLDTKSVYAVQEHKTLPEGRLEYDFAAEPARYVRIYIESNVSCFLGARIDWVSYIP